MEMPRNAYINFPSHCNHYTLCFRKRPHFTF